MIVRDSNGVQKRDVFVLRCSLSQAQCLKSSKRINLVWLVNQGMFTTV